MPSTTRRYRVTVLTSSNNDFVLLRSKPPELANACGVSAQLTCSPVLPIFVAHERWITMSTVRSRNPQRQLRKLQNILSLMDKHASPIYEFNGFRLIPSERLLLRNGGAVPLTHKVFDILLLLVRNRGQLVEKEEMLDAVWPEQFVEQHNLTVSMSALRKALGESPDKHEYIETVPKHGYRFIANVREFPNDSSVQSKRHTPSTEAHHLYLKGRYNWNKRTPFWIERAVQYFEQAIQLDPHYALAYAGLADSYNLMAGNSGLPPSETFPKARAAALRALEIDDTLAEAHTSLALVRYLFDWQWSAAERGFQRAIELNPNYATAHHWYGEYLGLCRRFDEGFKELVRRRSWSHCHFRSMRIWANIISSRAGMSRLSSNSRERSNSNPILCARWLCWAGPLNKWEGLTKRLPNSSRRPHSPAVVR